MALCNPIACVPGCCLSHVQYPFFVRIYLVSFSLSRSCDFCSFLVSLHPKPLWHRSYAIARALCPNKTFLSIHIIPSLHTFQPSNIPVASTAISARSFL